MNASNLHPTLPLSIDAGRLPGLKRATVLFWRWYDRRQQRLVLASLDARALCDLGLTRQAAMDEASKPFWRG